MRVLAALSGGVDSAVAAAKAVEAGHDVVGVHMALSSQPQECRIGSRGCCSIEDAGDAARAAEIIGIPFYVWDLAQEFEQTVIKAAQRQGRKLQIMGMTGPGWDHPYLSTYPEGRYLKVLWAIAL